MKVEKILWDTDYVEINSSRYGEIAICKSSRVYQNMLGRGMLCFLPKDTVKFIELIKDLSLPKFTNDDLKSLERLDSDTFEAVKQIIIKKHKDTDALFDQDIGDLIKAFQVEVEKKLDQRDWRYEMSGTPSIPVIKMALGIKLIGKSEKM